MNTTSSVSDARSFFPRGLVQPQGCFRFSMDALLLAAFVRTAKKTSVLDLGAGCGVIGLSLLLTHSHLDHVLGIDVDEAMVEAARSNANLLGEAERYAALNLDISDLRTHEAVGPESFDMVVANPPYRKQDQGRHAQSTQRSKALFELQGGMEVFCQAAAYALKNTHACCMIYDAERLSCLLRALVESKLEPKRLRVVHSRQEEPGRLVLVEARKNGKPGLRIEAPLVLYRGQGERTALTAQALEFCPYLFCNAGERAR